MFCFTLCFQKERVLITSTKVIAKKMKNYLHDRGTKCYIENACHQYPDL